MSLLQLSRHLVLERIGRVVVVRIFVTQMFELV